jgi:hypothetical protein
VSLALTREADLAARWEMRHEQFRELRRRHGWAHVKFSRQDIRYTDAQIEQIVRDMTATGTPKPAVNEDAGLTKRSARRAS